MKTTHPDAPITYLYFHSIELFLKAFLGAHGHTIEELEKKCRHHIGRMRDRATEVGLTFLWTRMCCARRYMEKPTSFEKPLHRNVAISSDRRMKHSKEQLPVFENTVCAAVRQITGVNVRS